MARESFKRIGLSRFLLEGILGLVHVDQRQPLVTQSSAHAKRLVLLKGHTSDLVLVGLTLCRGGRRRLHEPYVLALDRLLLVDAVSASHLRVVSHPHRSRNDNQGDHADGEERGRHDNGDQQLHSRLLQIEACNHEERVVLVVIAGISTLRGLIVAVATMSELKLSALPPQGVDATLEINVQSRTIVDR